MKIFSDKSFYLSMEICQQRLQDNNLPGIQNVGITKIQRKIMFFLFLKIIYTTFLVKNVKTIQILTNLHIQFLILLTRLFFLAIFDTDNFMPFFCLFGEDKQQCSEPTHGFLFRVHSQKSSGIISVTRIKSGSAMCQRSALSLYHLSQLSLRLSRSLQYQVFMFLSISVNIQHILHRDKEK